MGDKPIILAPGLNDAGIYSMVEWMVLKVLRLSGAAKEDSPRADRREAGKYRPNLEIRSGEERRGGTLRRRGKAGRDGGEGIQVRLLS